MTDGGSGFWAVVIMIAVTLVSLYLFFEVLGFTPAASAK